MIPDLNAYLIYMNPNATSITSKNIDSTDKTGLFLERAIINSPVDNCYKFYRVVTNVAEILNYKNP